MRKRSLGDQIVQVLIYIIVGTFALVTLLPFLYILAGSFATERELTERAFFIIPHTWSLNAFKYVMETGDIFKGMRNTILVTVVGTFLDMVFTTTFAYPLSRKNFKGRNAVLNLVIVTMLFQGE